MCGHDQCWFDIAFFFYNINWIFIMRISHILILVDFCNILGLSIKRDQTLEFVMLSTTWLFLALSDVMPWCLFPMLVSKIESSNFEHNWSFEPCFHAIFGFISLGFAVSFGEGRRIRWNSEERGSSTSDFGTSTQATSALQLHSKLGYFCRNLRNCRWLIKVSRIQRKWSGSHFSPRNLTIGGYQTWKAEAMKIIKPGSHLCRRCHSNQGRHHNEPICLAAATATFSTVTFTHNPFIPMNGWSSRLQ